jgi:hypothetical protein
MRERIEDNSIAPEAGASAPLPATAFALGFEPVMEDVPLAPAVPGSDVDESTAFSLVPEDVEPAGETEDRDELRWVDDEPPAEEDEPPARRYSPSPRPAEIFVINPAARRANSAATFDRLDRLVKDIAEITQARETLLAERAPLRVAASRPQIARSRLIRAAESVPIILGSVVGLLVMMVIGIAALFTNFAR